MAPLTVMRQKLKIARLGSPAQQKYLQQMEGDPFAQAEANIVININAVALVTCRVSVRTLKTASASCTWARERVVSDS